MSFLSKTLGKIVGGGTGGAQGSQNSVSSSTSSSSKSPESHQFSNQSVQAAGMPPVAQPSSSSSTRSSSMVGSSTSASYHSDAQLTITHLRKLFYEYLHPKNPHLSENDRRDEKLYSILPLFIKAFGHASLNDINEKFNDIGEFCFACSRLLVNEISKRVHDDLVLVKFFEMKTSEDATDGAGLLNTVNLLASGPLFLIEIMTKCALPSRLVMCVYLFICLPEAKDSILDHCEFNAKERRILFQKCFQQLLLKLCQNGCTCDELVEADSLKLLFKIITSTCEQHNIPWRQTATDALLILTKSFSVKAINYVHDNECIQTCLQCFDPDDICAANLVERAELLITLITFLRETCFLSQTLLDDFKHTSGYRIAIDVILRLERDAGYKDDSAKLSVLRRLFLAIEELVYSGFVEIKPIVSNLNTNVFKIDGFQVPQPLGRGKTVRNTLAFQCLLNLFNKSQTFDICMMVLECIKNIYKKDECNYFILESQNLLLYSLDDTSIKIHIRSHDLQIKFVEILEFIAFGLKFVPCKELVSIGLTIQNYNCNKWSINCANLLIKLVKTNSIYKDAFRELGLLEMTVSCLQKFAVLLKEKHVDSKEEIQIEPQQKELGFLIMDLICLLISQNIANAKIFRELGGARIAHNMVPYKLCRNQALNIVSTLLLSTAGEDDMSTLLGLMHTAQMEDLELKNSVLKSLLFTLRESHRTRTVFRKAGGFVYVVSVLISMEGSLSSPPKSPWDKAKKQDIFAIIRTILHTLTVSMRYEPANAKFFETEVRWKSLCAALKLLGCFDPSKTQFEPRTNIDFVKRGFDVFEKFFCGLDDSILNQSLPSTISPVDSAQNSPPAQQTPTNSASGSPIDSPISPSKANPLIYNQMDEKLIYICYIMRFLYDTALDAFDKTDSVLDFCDSFEERPFNRYPNRYFQSLTSETLQRPTTTSSQPPQSLQNLSSSPNELTNSNNNSPVRRSNATSSSFFHSHNSVGLNSSFIDEPFIIHPGAISSILHLLPQISSNQTDHMASRLQFHMVSLIKNLLKFERNQQIMSNANFIEDILTTCKLVLNDETHFLNSSIQHIFERLATQSITAKCLREYLRLGTVFDKSSVSSLISNPSANSAAASTSALIPLNRVKCLISMTTPRDTKQYLGTCFVEFNMMVEGFGCLFLPSIAPQLINAPSIVAMGMVSVGNDLSVNGGIGSGERVFPPQSGLSFSTWIYIEKFGSPLIDTANTDQATRGQTSSPIQTHPIRLLTLIKHSKIKDTLTSCLTVSLNAKHRSLTVSTEEQLLTSSNSMSSQQARSASIDNSPTNDYTTKFNCSELFQEGQWLHIVLVWSRAVLKNSQCTLYVNSNLIGSHKLHYINANSMQSNQAPPSSMSIHACIGTLPIFRAQSPVVWRQASCYLFEEMISLSHVNLLYQLGPNYLGSFQSPSELEVTNPASMPNQNSSSMSGTGSNPSGGGSSGVTMGGLSSHISEEKIIFGLHAHKVFEMTLSKFRKVYNKNDSKSIGKQLNIPSHENVTPLRILSNTAAQLNGPARTIGGVLIGYMGVRTFQPIPVSKSIEHIGGVWFLLGLIAMANDIEFMYAAVKALVCVCKSNPEIGREFERLNGYQLLGMLYKRKKSLINSHILNLTFSLAINDDNGKEQAVISNLKAFECLLCDFDIWSDTPVEIQKSLHERFNDLLNDSQQMVNVRLFQRHNMLKRLLYVLREPNSVSFNDNTLKFILSTIRILLVETSSQNEDLIKYGQYLAALLPNRSVNENDVDVVSNNPEITYKITLRNRLFSIVDDIVALTPPTNKSIGFQEELQRTLGYDWFLLFMQPNVHHTTLIKSVKILFTLLLNVQNLNRFKESNCCSGWLNNVYVQPIQASNHYQQQMRMQSQTSVMEPLSTASQTGSNTTPNASTTATVTPASSVAPPKQLSLGTSFANTLDMPLEINTEVCSLPGFQIMQIYFAKQSHLTELYYLLFALLFDAQRIKDLPPAVTVDSQLDLNTICKYVFEKSFDSSEQTLFSKINTDISLDITIILLGMIRSLMNEENKTSTTTEELVDERKTKDYAIILLQIFRFMYHNCDEFRAITNHSDFLGALIATVFPHVELTQQQASTPAPLEIKPFAEAICDAQAKSIYKSYLSVHPARKLVMDFLRDLLYDGIMQNNNTSTISSQITRVLTSQQSAASLLMLGSAQSLSSSSLVANNTGTPSLIDAILMCLPTIDASPRRHQEFLTELFKTMLDHLGSSDLLNENASINASSVSPHSSLPHFYQFIDRLCDKLWEGAYRRDSKELLDTLLKFLNNLKRKPFSNSFAHEPLINSINRVLLYQLSRPSRYLNEQVAMLDVLHRINKLKTLLFATTGAGQAYIQPEFYGCLAYCLLQITLPGKSGSTGSGDGNDEIGLGEESRGRTSRSESRENVVDLAKGVNTKTQWYINTMFKETVGSTMIIDDKEGVKNARNLLNSAAQRVWLDLYLSKKSQLEECLKVNLNSLGKNPTLDELRPILSEPAQRVWTSFLEGEKKLPEKIQSQIQARFQRVTGGISNMAGGFSRVVSLKKPKKEVIRLSMRELTEAAIAISGNLALLYEYVDAEYKKYARNSEQKHGYLYAEWLKIERELLRERALWGEDEECELNKWKLDFTEGPSRQRKRLLPNTEDFFRNYPYRPELESWKPNRKYKIPSSVHGKEYAKRFQVKSLLHYNQYWQEYVQTQQEFANMQQNQQTIDMNISMAVTDLETSASAPPVSADVADGEIDSMVEFKRNLKNQAQSSGESALKEQDSIFINEVGQSGQTGNELSSSTNNTSATTNTSGQSALEKSTTTSTSNNQNIMRLLEEGEKITHIYRCARVQGLDTTEGVFLFGREHFYVLDGFTLVSTKDIVDIDSLKPSSYEPLIPKCGGSMSTTGSVSQFMTPSIEKSCSKFAYEDIREVHKRRYLLQEIAMEIFSNDGRNYLLVFPRKCRSKVYDRLIALIPDTSDTATQSIAGQRRSINIEQNSSIFNALIGEKSVVQRWERGEISNFQYLMFLNTLAGRSYNDLMQYPVFPWILADYDSPELDLANPGTFRDLSKPMGAQTPDRLKQFEKRYIEWEDPSGETPPYHYGTHYSSAMIVASYLLRIEPFTQIFLRLQGGHFDLADRMFHSVKDSWLSASKNNMADVKELIPEFFYQPEFLLNANRFDLGRKQSGVVLDDVVLPAWAKNDPREFIRIHRLALESDFVSAHLNEWIDLIFGYKQQGQPAVDAANVFHHLFYEGAVNIDEIDDPLKRNAIIGFINNFGQIPKQLFKRPHPCKKLNIQLLHGFMGLGSTAANLVNMGTNDQQLLAVQSSSLAHSNAAASAPASMNQQLTGSSHHPLVFIHYLRSLKPSLQPIKELKSQVGQIVCTDKGILVVEQNKFLMPPSYQRYIAWGYTDESIRIGYTDYERSYVTFENIQEGAIFACCSPDSRVVVTAGTSCVVNVWELSKAMKMRRMQLKARLYAHTDTVTCMAVSNQYHMLVTGSRDQSCIIWDINRWMFVRQLPNHYSAVSSICINELTGDIATASSTYLYVWNINGVLLASINTITSSRNHTVLCVCMSQVNEWDNNNVILTGGTDGIIRMWSLDYNQVKIDSNDQSPSAICKTGDEKQSTPYGNRQIESNPKFFPESFSPSVEMSTSQQRTSMYSSMQSESGVTSPTSAPVVDLKPTFFNPSSHSESEDGVENSINSDQATPLPVPITSVPDLDDFVFIESNQIDKLENKSILKPGYKWKRELVFKSKLTMHTSYDRKDNSEPASVTSIAISRDHKTIYVGDSRGRVFTWVCTEQPGRARADHWVRDDTAEQCKQCHVKFSFSERRHHCRDCGGVFCNACSRYETEIPRLHINKPVRVCEKCYNFIKNEETNTKT